MADQQRLKNAGKTSEAIFVAELESRKAAVFRMRDAADLFGLNKRKVANFGMPSDYIVVCPHGMFFAEVKSSNKKTSFTLDALTAAQKNAAARCHIAHSGKFYRIYIHNMVTDTWYIMDGSTYVSLTRQGVKSVKWSDLRPLSFWLY